MSAEPLAVHVAGRYAGEIDRIGNRLRLAYDADYAVSASAVPLSLSLPLDREVIVGAEVAGWLDGLLPGNERVRRRWAARHDA
ncbi:MAG: HipA N-terminal domain-containing protein, partial [bacterium]|nr:HipA N-terminal domain-containing protein [bacterium]